METLADDKIELKYAPDIPGLTFRHYRGESDLAEMMAVFNASNIADGDDWVMTYEEMKNDFAHLVNCDPATDLIVAEVDGAMAGYTFGRWSLELNGPYKYFFYANLHPDWRGKGLRRTLLRWAEERMGEVATQHPAAHAKVYETYSGMLTPELSAHLEENGFEAVRYFYEMARPNLDDIPDFPMPEGLEMRPVLPDQYRTIWDADREAFRDHWGASERSEERYQQWLNSKTIFQPALWQIAWDIETDEVAGQVRTFIDHNANEQFGRLRGYTEFISTRRPWRRLGLAKALIAESLRVQREQGMAESALSVDAENPQGALQLYKDCGFETEKEFIAYRKPVTL